MPTEPEAPLVVKYNGRIINTRDKSGGNQEISTREDRRQKRHRILLLSREKSQEKRM